MVLRAEETNVRLGTFSAAIASFNSAAAWWVSWQAASSFIAVSAAHELHAGEVRDRLPELTAFLHVINGIVQRALGDAERLGRHRDPVVVEGGQRGLEVRALRADETVGGDARIVENDGPARDPLMHANSCPEKLIDQMKELGICRLDIQ